MITVSTVKRGLHKGFYTTWELTKVVVPVYIVVTFLKYTPAMDFIARFCEPAMKILGLPGEASIVLVLGNLLNIYAAIGAISSLHLSAKAITILATMLLISHSLPIESAVSKKTGVSPLLMVGFRLVMSLLAGAALNLLL
ncbi:nucleoside recognition domain-containing protein [Desulfofundulus thermosubterraneus]|uniref:Nucleoside recognition n=1 Tax=Desulfofundulus thermosubterraneus DSM 16057 TaxID=1121432 RepID=A0A1M6EZM6_9FIRM|nr:nucleoside recognition domain-containing protein [Desulfofundulus thermosubterraneus]SHI90928.1 Nucleoside recognition [Desulfofundulus thermosubterraneus DSM 16057]